MANPTPSPGTAEPAPLSSDQIADALEASTDQGQTLDFSHKVITEITDEASHELAMIGRADGEDEGWVNRCVVASLMRGLPVQVGIAHAAAV